jgi:hypothetical protein
MEKYTSLYHIDIYFPGTNIGIDHYPSYGENEWEAYSDVKTYMDVLIELDRYNTLSGRMLEIKEYTSTHRPYSIIITFRDYQDNMRFVNKIILDEVHHNDDWLTMISDVIRDQWALDYGSRMVKSARK